MLYGMHGDFLERGAIFCPGFLQLTYTSAYRVQTDADNTDT